MDERTSNPSACPVCGRAMTFHPRYPRAVCPACAQRTVDRTGRPVRFFNQDMDGGLVGQYADTGQTYPETACWVAGTACRAEEAHLGGVVILASESPSE